MRFVVVYQREPHGRQQAFQDVPQPKTRAERVALAQKTLAELKLDVDVWIDDLGDQSRALFGDLPNSAIVIDKVGTIAMKLPWCDPKAIAGALPQIPELVLGKPVAPADTHFLRRVEDAKLPAHHRHTMLAHLVESEQTHSDREAWLRELAANGPPQQIAWAKARLPHTTVVDRPEKEATAVAIREGKLLLYNFTAFNCASCRIMEEHTFRDPEVARVMQQHLVELRVHTDSQNRLRDDQFAKNRAMQERLAKTRANPFYVVVDPANGATIAIHKLSGPYSSWGKQWRTFVEQAATKAGRVRPTDGDKK